MQVALLDVFSQLEIGFWLTIRGSAKDVGKPLRRHPICRVAGEWIAHAADAGFRNLLHQIFAEDDTA
ncbi:hypothetical protein [Rhizobium ruizarguesonis]